MCVMLLDYKRNWIKTILEKHGHEVCDFDKNINIINSMDIILVHDTDFRKKYFTRIIEKGNWQQVYSEFFMVKKVVVYSGGEIEGLSSSANLIIVPWKILYEENSCPANFKKYLISLDEKLLVSKQKTHLIALSILCQGYLAAHGGDGLDGWSDEFKKLLVAGAEEKTKGKNWWSPVFDNEELGKEFVNTKICEELKTLGEDCSNDSPIKKLFEAVKKINKNGNDIKGEVAKAYSALKSILKG